MFVKIAIAISLVFTVALISLAINRTGQVNSAAALNDVASTKLSALEKQLTIVNSIKGEGGSLQARPIDDAVLLAAKNWPTIAKNHFATIAMINPKSKASSESAEFTNGVTSSPLGFKVLSVNANGTYKSIVELSAMFSEITNSGVALSALTLNNNIYTATLEIYGK